LHVIKNRSKKFVIQRKSS